VGKTKHGILTATASSLGQFGGIISALIFPKKDGPYYVPGVSVCVGFSGLGLVLASLMWFFLYMENQARETEREIICATYQGKSRTNWARNIPISVILFETRWMRIHC